MRVKLKNPNYKLDWLHIFGGLTVDVLDLTGTALFPGKIGRQACCFVDLQKLNDVQRRRLNATLRASANITKIKAEMIINSAGVPLLFDDCDIVEDDQ
jgi:hypothetical protein